MAWYNSVANYVGNALSLQPASMLAQPKVGKQALNNAASGKVFSSPYQNTSQPSIDPNKIVAYGADGTPYNAGGDPVGYPASNNSAPTSTDSGSSGGSGYYYGTGGSGSGSSSGVYNPAAAQPPPPDLTALRDSVTGRIQAMQNAYHGLTGTIDQIVNERAARNAQDYTTQQQNLSNSYQNTANQQAGIYGARGIGDSSFLGNAQQDAGNIYNQNLQSLLQNQQDTNAQLGQYAASNKAQFGAGANQYNDVMNNLGNYDQAGLQSLNDTLGQSLGNVQAQQAGLGTNASFINGLQAIAPTQNQGATQLQAKLDQLVNSGAPGFAKNQIAQGLVKQAQLTDPTAQAYWTNYYQKLLNGQG